MDILNLIGRDKELFDLDVKASESHISEIIKSSSFLILGGAGSIGQAVTKEIYKRDPLKLYVVDINENNMTELVRDLRSSYDSAGDFKTFVLDIGSVEYEAFISVYIHFDYVLNFSALKHVRSEKDPFTLMRMIDVNILNTEKTIHNSITHKAEKYFCVSTDKATNPVNMMGASKRIMEMFLMNLSQQIDISTARFANVAFSDGSLLHGFNQRIQKRQPIVAPSDIKRYFVTPKESGELCLLSCLLGKNRDIFYPKLDEKLHLISFSDIAVKYLNNIGYEPYLCASEKEARDYFKNHSSIKKWPCLFTSSDTTGEKDFEEFYTANDDRDLSRFESIGIIKNQSLMDATSLIKFKEMIAKFKAEKKWTKEQIVDLFIELIPEFKHKETGKYLDAKM